MIKITITEIYINLISMFTLISVFGLKKYI